MIPAASVNIMDGESGIGKSPLCYDLLTRVAAGLRFLNLRVTAGRTLMVDFENGADRYEVCQRLLENAGLEHSPEQFKHDPEPGIDFKEKIEYFRPSLVVIDSLKLYRPEALQGDGVAALEMLRELQDMARAYSTAFVLIHHLRKADRKAPLPDLTTTPVLEWLQDAAGTRSFINQTTTRRAIAQDRVSRNEREVLVLRYFQKMHGEFGPVYVERIFRDDGEPIASMVT